VNFSQFLDAAHDAKNLELGRSNVGKEHAPGLTTQTRP